jgi:hypothetical protein
MPNTNLNKATGRGGQTNTGAALIGVAGGASPCRDT